MKYAINVQIMNMINDKERKKIFFSTLRWNPNPQYIRVLTYKSSDPCRLVYIWYLMYPYHAYIQHDSFSLHFGGFFIAIFSHFSVHNHCRHCKCTDIVTEIESWMKFMCESMWKHSMYVLFVTYANNQQKAFRAIKVIFCKLKWREKNEKIHF